MRLNSRFLILMLAVASIGLFAASSQAQITYSEEPKGEKPQQTLGELGWKQVASPHPDALGKVQFVNDSLVFVLGFTKTESPVIMRSNNSGISWSSTTLLTAGGDNIHFFSETEFLSTRFGAPPNFFWTEDGGVRWDTLSKEESGGDLGRPGRLFFLSRDTGYAAGGNSMMRTTDRGKHWKVWGAGAGNIDIYATDSRHAVVASAYAPGIVFVTEDAGEHWEERTASLQYGFSAIWALDNKTLVTASPWGGLARSSNGGHSWVDTVVTQDGIGMTSLYFLNNGTGFAAGSKGQIYRTVDTGRHWRRQETPTIEALNSINFLNDSMGLAVGAKGTILRTTNAGLAWVQVAPTPLPLINRIVLSESGMTSLRYELPSTEKVTLTIYSLTGAVVAVLKDHLIEHQGWHEVDLSSQLLQGGTYLYTITSGRYTSSGKFTMMR